MTTEAAHQVVYKYRFELGHDEDMTIPAGNVTYARMLGGTSNDIIEFWVNHRFKNEDRTDHRQMEVTVIGTGHRFGPEWEVAATIPDGRFIWHLLIQ